MQHSNDNPWGLAFLSGLLLWLGAGCGTRAVSVSPTVLPEPRPENKIPLVVGLVMDKSFRDYGLSVDQVGGPATYPVGAYLSSYAERVSRNLFKKVTVYDSVGAAVAPDKSDVILVPKAVRSGYFDERPLKVLLCVEWTVLDRTGKQTLWLTTIESEATEYPDLFSHVQQESAAFQQVFDELCARTLKAFRESPETKRLVSNRGAGHEPY